MSNQFTQFLAAYAAAPQQIKDFIDSEQIGLFADTFLTETTLSSKPKVLILISNRILNLSTDSEMITNLEQVGITDTAVITKIKNYILQVMGQTGPTQNTVAETVPSLRTMNGDSKQIGYSSTEESTYSTMQSAIINEGK